MTVAQFHEMFPDENACCAYLVENRWPEGVFCPRCGSHRVRRPNDMRWKWNCSECGRGGVYRFSHITGTVFENTKIPLGVWFRLLHLVLTTKPNMSVLQVQRRLALPSYKMAWHMHRRVRAVLMDKNLGTLIGMVMIDGRFGAGPAGNAQPDISRKSLVEFEAKISHPC
jgi:transposase-like protein